MKKILMFFVLVSTIGFLFSIEAQAGGSSFRRSWSRQVNSTLTQNLARREHDHYRFEVPRGGQGAYNIYTTGRTDVVGILYERNGIWPFQRRDMIGKSDDCGSRGNFRIEVDLDQHENYYIFVRGFSTRTTGNYKLHIRENVDSRPFTGSWKWESYARYHMQRLGTRDGFVATVRFYTPELVTELYEFLDRETYYEFLDLQARVGTAVALGVLGFVTKGIAPAIVLTFGGLILPEIFPSAAEVARANIFEAGQGVYRVIRGREMAVFSYGVRVESGFVLGRHRIVEFRNYERIAGDTINGAKLQRGQFVPYV